MEVGGDIRGLGAINKPWRETERRIKYFHRDVLFLILENVEQLAMLIMSRSGPGLASFMVVIRKTIYQVINILHYIIITMIM